MQTTFEHTANKCIFTQNNIMHSIKRNANTHNTSDIASGRKITAMLNVVQHINIFFLSVLLLEQRVRLIECSQNMYLMVENIYPKSEMNSKSIPISLYTYI
jgi:hypothetical protein